MKYLLSLLLLVSTYSYGQFTPSETFNLSKGYEIFGEITECRSTVYDEFKVERILDTYGFFSFEDDTLGIIISINGDFTNWQKEYLVQLSDGVTSTIDLVYDQVSFPVRNDSRKKLGVFSFIDGNYESNAFIDTLHIPGAGNPFRVVLTYPTKRYTYFGIY